MALDTGLRALPYVLVLTTVSTYAVGASPAASLTCYVIRPGDTAARLAQRYTGDARNRHQQWFQIFNPATASFVPKSHYAAIQVGWHVCVPAVASSFTPLPAPTVTRSAPAGNLPLLWWAAPLFVAVAGLALTWIVSAKHLEERRARRDIMRAYGERFVVEFERPLFRRHAERAAIRARLRVKPARHRLDILIAPAEGRTYPNLVDHRRNLEYDVERVQQLLGAPFVSGPPHAEGSWVVIPFRLETSRQQEGVL